MGAWWPQPFSELIAPVSVLVRSAGPFAPSSCLSSTATHAYFVQLSLSLLFCKVWLLKNAAARGNTAIDREWVSQTSVESLDTLCSAPSGLPPLPVPPVLLEGR